MRMRNLALVLVLVACVPLAATAGQTAAKDQVVTTGDFAVMLAAATGKGRDLGKDAAIDALRKAGVPLGDSRAALSEKDLAAILVFYGAKAVTSSPDRGVTVARAETALLAASSFLTTASGSVSVNQSAADVCLSEPNTGQCVNCCKDLGGTTKSCTTLCIGIKKASPSEPLP